MTAVETALVLLTALFFIVGVAEFSRIYWSWNTVQLAAQEGSRYAMINSNNPTLASCSPSPAPTVTSCTGTSQTKLANCAAYQTQQNLIAFSASNVSITVTCGTAHSQSTLQVQAAYNFNFVATGLFPYGQLTLTGTALVPLD